MLTDYVLRHYIGTNTRHALESLPDRITVQRPDPAGFTVDEGGTPVPSGPLFLTYEGSTIIPCRFDNSRSFRPDALRTQEVVANEHMLHYPNGLDIRPDDKITLLKPVELTTNSGFSAGLSGWTGAVSGATFQAVVLGGVRLTFADTITALLQQTVGTGLTGELLLIQLWAEVLDGTLQLATPAGNLILNEGENQRFEVRGLHAGVTHNISIRATAQPAQAIVTSFKAWRYKQHRFFEARKFTNTSEWDVTAEALVTEMEFQHSDD